MAQRQQQAEKSLKNKDFVAWRILQDRRRFQEAQARREYNFRARQRRETRH